MTWSPEEYISPVVKAIPPSGIRRFFDLVSQEKGVISLGVGEPDFVTPWHIREASVYSLEKGYTMYTSNYGLPELRQEVARYLKRRFDLCYQSQSEILITVGVSEAVDLGLRAVLCPGDEVLIPDPAYVSYMPCTVMAGGVAVALPTSAASEFKVTSEALRQKITPRTKAVILTFPSNPTGAIMTKEELAAVAEVAKEHNLLVISDEIYAELTYEGRHVSIASLPEMRDRTVVLNGFSKAFAMTGWRLGYACAHPEIIKAMVKIHQYAIMCAPTTAQYAAIEALRNADDSVDEMVREYNHRRRVLVNGFRKLGLDCFEPLGAFYVFPSIQSTGLSSEDFCEQLLISQKVLVVPGTAFGECGEGFVRACYASSMEQITEALNRIERFLSQSAL